MHLPIHYLCHKKDTTIVNKHNRTLWIDHPRLWNIPVDLNCSNTSLFKSSSFATKVPWKRPVCVRWHQCDRAVFPGALGLVRRGSAGLPLQYSSHLHALQPVKRAPLSRKSPVAHTHTCTAEPPINPVQRRLDSQSSFNTQTGCLDQRMNQLFCCQSWYDIRDLIKNKLIWDFLTIRSRERC